MSKRGGNEGFHVHTTRTWYSFIMLVHSRVSLFSDEDDARFEKTSQKCEVGVGGHHQVWRIEEDIPLRRERNLRKRPSQKKCGPSRAKWWSIVTTNFVVSIIIFTAHTLHVSLFGYLMTFRSDSLSEQNTNGFQRFHFNADNRNGSGISFLAGFWFHSRI